MCALSDFGFVLMNDQKEFEASLLSNGSLTLVGYLRSPGGQILRQKFGVFPTVLAYRGALDSLIVISDNPRTCRADHNHKPDLLVHAPSSRRGQ